MPDILRQNIDTTQDGALIIGGSSNVFVNGYGVVRLGDAVTPHYHGMTLVHPVMNSGSSSVFCNGIAVCRNGDTTTYGDHGIGGSSNVISG